MLIGEVARRSGVSTRMLRHYDSLGLVRPTGRTVGGYREYSAEDIRRIFHVESLRTLGLSLREVARALEDPAFTPAALVRDLIGRTRERLERERELLDRLQAVDASAPSGWDGALRIIQLLHGLNSPSAAQRQRTVLVPADTEPVPTELLAGAVLSESDPHVAGALRWALAQAGDDGVASVASGVRSKDVAVRRRAVAAIAELPGERATAVLAKALRDPDVTVRRLVAPALGKRGVVAAVPTLVAMVVEGANDVEAAEVLGALALDEGNADRVLGALVGALAAHPANPAVRIRLAQALVEMPGTLAHDALRHLTRDDDPSVARVAAALLTMVEDRDRPRPSPSRATPPQPPARQTHPR